MYSFQYSYTHIPYTVLTLLTDITVVDLEGNYTAVADLEGGYIKVADL